MNDTVPKHNYTDNELVVFEVIDNFPFRFPYWVVLSTLLNPRLLNGAMDDSLTDYFPVRLKA